MNWIMIIVVSTGSLASSCYYDSGDARSSAWNSCCEDFSASMILCHADVPKIIIQAGGKEAIAIQGAQH